MVVCCSAAACGAKYDIWDGKDRGVFYLRKMNVTDKDCTRCRREEKRDMSTESRKIIKHIKENYKRLEEGIVNQLYFENEHSGTIGSYREKIWKEMFQSIIPKKFVIEQSVFLIDSKGNVSNEVDLVIFDEMYTPYIFRYYNLKFIPIEAVAVVVECKSTSMDETTGHAVLQI